MAFDIDPFGSWSDRDGSKPCYTIGVGQAAGTCDTYLSAQDWLAFGLADPSRLPRTSCPIGATMASCIGTANAFKASFDLTQPMFNGALSLWNFGRDSQALPGIRIPGDLEIGKVAMIGAGAVGSSLAYWMSQLPIRAEWDVIDADLVHLSNTNRSLCFTASDAGIYGDGPGSKARIVASALRDATPHVCWYDDFIKMSDQRWDLYLPLANDRSARYWVQREYPPLMLHATTSVNWQSQLHRHRPEHDRCLTCRLPETRLVPDCARGVIEAASPAQSVDAALPFLSASAAAMLAADLIKLGSRELQNAEGNLITIDWHGGSTGKTTRTEQCDEGCQNWGARGVRADLNGHTMWYSLDRAAAS